MSLRLQLVGRRFGRLKVIAFARVDRHFAVYVVCRCSCPAKTKIVVRGNHLRAGHTRSCGCLAQGGGRFRHGESIGLASFEFRAWSNMIQRCTHPEDDHWADYGGRGIKVCRRWQNLGAIGRGFRNFLKDMGRKPKPWLSLDRKNNDRDYKPSNCHWATKSEQNKNQRRNK